ncbi:transcriptional regulator [Pilimelia anulata]|uniref:Transcriptional regulator n=2 Tax=Pilimelia anulata TaxID=53371 RepID=A0A8J3BH16_9ACTN|nr:transcriptional regulator [Pilimelia anulata]
MHFTRLSKIENGVVVPTEANIRRWCELTDAVEHAEDLLASVRNLSNAYVEFNREARTLRKMTQDRSMNLYRDTTLFRIHENVVIPGIFQVEPYTRAMLAFWWRFLEVPDDTETVLPAKQIRTGHALNSSKRVVVTLEEEALRMRFGDAGTQEAQLTQLLAVMRLPYVSLGIIPSGIDRGSCVSSIGFWIFDDVMVTMETATAYIEVTQPGEIRQWAKLFGHLQALASYGKDARRLITKALDEL